MKSFDRPSLDAPVEPMLALSGDRVPLPEAPAERLEHGQALTRDMSQAVRNAGQLGASLVLTWMIAMLVRVGIPRALGPEVFGRYQFAESFALMLFAVTYLGAETYVRTQVSRDARDASRWIGGVLVVRVLAGLVALFAAMLALRWAGKPTDVLTLVLIMGIAQFAVVANALGAALLQAVGEVRGLSAVNVLAKALWGAGVLVALTRGLGANAIAAGLLVSEFLRLAFVWRLVQKYLPVRLQLDLGATRTVIVACLPFFLNDIAVVVNQRIGVGVLSFSSSDVEVGWYGAAVNVAGLAMLLTPIIGSVFMPLLARAHARSDEEVALIGRRAMVLILAVSIPCSLALGLGADVIVPLLFGEAFVPAIGALRVTSPIFALTYAAIVTAIVLNTIGRGWSLTLISLSTCLLTPVLNLVLIPWGTRTFGMGGAGIGAATATLLCEAYVVAHTTWLVGRYVFDRAVLVATAKMCGVALGVIALHVALGMLSPWLRLAIDGAVYVAGVAAWGAVDITAARNLLRVRRATGA